MKSAYKITSLLVCIYLIFNCSASYGQSLGGVSIGGGAGVFVAQDKERYMGIQTDIYPELGMYIDIRGIRLGLTGGLIYRYKEEWVSYWGDYYYYEYTYDYKMMFIPVQGEIALIPLRMLNKKAVIQPFLSVSGGAYIPIGGSDYRNTELCASIKLGGEVYFMNYGVAYVDVRYMYADGRLGGFIGTLGFRFRIPFGGREE